MSQIAFRVCAAFGSVLMSLVAASVYTSKLNGDKQRCVIVQVTKSARFQLRNVPKIVWQSAVLVRLKAENVCRPTFFQFAQWLIVHLYFCSDEVGEACSSFGTREEGKGSVRGDRMGERRERKR